MTESSPDQQLPDNQITVWGIGTTRTMRVHWMLMELGLDYAFEPIRSRTGETQTERFLKLNPKHKIPVLRHGKLVLTESPAIVSYLAESFEPPPGFFVPRDATARARLHEWCYFIMMDLDCVSLYVIRRHGDLHEIYGEAPNAVDGAKAYFEDLSAAMLKRLPEDFTYLMPEGFSTADILLTTCLGFARERGIQIPEPLLDYEQRLMQRPAFREAHRRNHPEAGA